MTDLMDTAHAVTSRETRLKTEFDEFIRREIPEHAGQTITLHTAHYRERLQKAFHKGVLIGMEER